MGSGRPLSLPFPRPEMRRIKAFPTKKRPDLAGFSALIGLLENPQLVRCRVTSPGRLLWNLGIQAANLVTTPIERSIAVR